MQERADSRTSEMLKQLLPRGRTDTNDWAKEPGTALIVAEEESLETANAQFALCMATNELSRLYPVITHLGVLVPNSATLSANVPLFAQGRIQDALMNFVNELQPDCKVEFVDTASGYWDATLSIGASRKGLENVVSIASNGWMAYVSKNELSASFTDRTNPIGAYAAACIGGMEVFKKIFLKKSNLLSPEKGRSDARWRLKSIEGQTSFSTFDYKVNESYPKNPELPTSICLEDLCIVGTGAGGGAVAYVLASLHDLQGRLSLIDPDEVKPGNMNRYIYALHADSARNGLKVEVVKELFKRLEKFDVRTFPCSYQELKEPHKIVNMDILISTVDTKETRRNIQWDMPRVILDAAVVSTDFYVRRVDLGKSPCLLCTHKAKEVQRSLEEILSEVTGIDEKEILRLRSTNARFTQEHLDLMKEFSVIHGFALPSVGDRFSDWLIIHCGEFASFETHERIPLPFATILPGILIAGEVIKDRHFPNDTVQNYYSYDMINVPSSGTTPLKPASDCIFCSSSKTKETYARKYEKL